MDWQRRTPPSPDLNLLDYFVWGYLKSLVYSTPVTNLEELRERVAMGCEIIRNMPGIFQRVFASMNRRLAACVEMNGAHFEHLI